MLPYFVGALVAIAFILLLGVAMQKGWDNKTLRTALSEFAVRTEHAEKSEKDLRDLIANYAGRPFHITIDDHQIQVLADRIENAIPKVVKPIVN